MLIDKAYSPAENQKMSKADELDAMIDIIPTQMKEMLSQVQDKCKAYVAAAKEEVVNLKADAAKIVEDAHQNAETMKVEVEKHVEEMKVELANWEEEKNHIASTHNFETTIKLDIGGQSFTTALTTLTRFPDTMLGAMFSGRHALKENDAGAHFIDRDGTHFRYILNFLRSPESFDNSCVPRSTLAEVMLEADYYGLKDLMFPLSPPVTTTNDYGKKVIITQDEDRLWYMQCNDVGGNPVIVQVCDSCQYGWPFGNRHLGVAIFTAGRIITAAQRKSATCGCCT